MTTTIPALPTSWASSTAACVAQVYGNSPAALISRWRAPLLVDIRRVVLALVADCERGPYWMSMGTALHRAPRTVFPHLAVLREHRLAQDQEILSDLRGSIRTVSSLGRPGQGHERSPSLPVRVGAPGCMTMQHNGGVCSASCSTQGQCDTALVAQPPVLRDPSRCPRRTTSSAHPGAVSC